MNTDKYSMMADEEIIELIRQGRDEAMDYLLYKYKNVVRIKARTMFLIGGDNDDLIQEGMIGLYKAIRDYQVDREASFAGFASMCISRQIYTAVAGSNRKKHSPLNSYVSFSGISEEEPVPVQSGIREVNPEALLIDKETVDYLTEKIQSRLSKFEKEVLHMYMEGVGYVEIAERMDKKPKAIDNALQRIRNKVNEVVRESKN